MSNVITLLDADLKEIETALQDRPLKFALPLLQKIDSQLRAAAAATDAEALKVKEAAESEVSSLRKQVEAFTASAKAGIVHVLDEVKSAL